MSDKQRRWPLSRRFWLLADKKILDKGHWSATDTKNKQSLFLVSVAAEDKKRCNVHREEQSEFEVKVAGSLREATRERTLECNGHQE